MVYRYKISFYFVFWKIAFFFLYKGYYHSPNNLTHGWTDKEKTEEGTTTVFRGIGT